MSGWGWAATTLGSLLFLGLVGLVAWSVVRAVRRPGDGPSWPAQAAGQDTAERLLADRFARGEIDEDEYRRRLATLRNVGTR
ncbi:SHOCT domain-containing protein [Geodermatophilus sp. SYSU D01176]